MPFERRAQSLTSSSCQDPAGRMPPSSSKRTRPFYQPLLILLEETLSCSTTFTSISTAMGAGSRPNAKATRLSYGMQSERI